MTFIRTPNNIADKNKRDSISNNRKNIPENTTEDIYLEKAVTINAVIKELHHMSTPRGRSGVSRLPDNSNNAVSATNMSGVAE